MATVLYECSECGSRFDNIRILERHECPNHVESATTACPGSSSSSTSSQRQTMTTCDDCQGFFTLEELVRHQCPNNPRQPGSVQEKEGTSKTSVYSYWTRPATLMLINLYAREIKKVQRGVIRRKTMWASVEKDMREQGHYFTAEQIAGRFKTLHKGYKAIRDNNKKSGASRKDHEYQKELDELFHNDPVHEPVALLSSHATTQSESTPTTQSESNPTTQSESTETAPPEKKRRRSASSEAALVMRDFVIDINARRQHDEERRERQHKEKMDLLKSLIEAISK